jgi:hypothetical protein
MALLLLPASKQRWQLPGQSTCWGAAFLLCAWPLARQPTDLLRSRCARDRAMQYQGTKATGRHTLEKKSGSVGPAPIKLQTAYPRRLSPRCAGIQQR